MNRRKFIGLASGALVTAGATAYCLSDRNNLSRADLGAERAGHTSLKPDEHAILFLASLAPSGHNTQPWFVRRLEPYHWIVGNDRTRWLAAVDPDQRETMLSLGAFLQNLELAAGSYGYRCDWTLLATTNQDEQVMAVRLVKIASRLPFDLTRISDRRTLRAGFSRDGLNPGDVAALVDGDVERVNYLPANSPAGQAISEQTLEANRFQAYREPAQQELADWIRFSNRDAASHRDGLTTAGMEIDGVAGWLVRNWYERKDVLKTDFREHGIAKVKTQIAEAAGWIVITSPTRVVSALLETGRRMQNLFLKVRERGIAIHPMTQILEEPSVRSAFQQAVGLGENVQFILRVGYLKKYPAPVSLRRSVDRFLRD